MQNSNVTPKLEFYIRTIDRMLERREFDFAKSTLTGIRSTIVSSSTVTQNQIKAIFNIKRSTL